MDIIYQLPLPDVVCDKIFGYACKSPHTGLGVGLLKNRLNEKYLDIPEKDENVTHICYMPRHSSINIYFYTLFKSLIYIHLSQTGVTGDIAHLKSLPNLTEIWLEGTGVTGDIIHLKSLLSLTEIRISQTGVTGDIVHLKSLRNLTGIGLSQTGVSGDIAHLNSLRNLTHINLTSSGVEGNIADLKSMPSLTDIIGLWDTSVTGDENAFYNYRNNAGLEECELFI
jgi:hypothetical protein